MKILSIPTLAHDASICILENGIITFYKMEERYSRIKKKPLVKTFEHVVYTLKNSMIEYLYLPEIETLVAIKNKTLTYQ